MKKEKSCGCVIFNNNEVLVIKDTNGNYGFPKGHMENGETEVETAMRETKEETNVDVIIDENRRYEINYYIKERDIDKTVVFFRARYNGGDLKIQEGETEEIQWVPTKDVLNILTWKDSKEVYENLK
jgi:8-oxo-dGTP pyrophosphatase MutT (NUDIX family)